MWWTIGGLVFAVFIYWGFFTKSKPHLHSSVPSSDWMRFLEKLRQSGYDGGRIVVVPAGKQVEAPLEIVLRERGKALPPAFEVRVPLGGAWLQDSTGVDPVLRELGWSGETRASEGVLRIAVGKDLGTVQRVVKHFVQSFSPGDDLPIDMHFENVSVWKRH